MDFLCPDPRWKQRCRARCELGYRNSPNPRSSCPALPRPPTSSRRRGPRSGMPDQRNRVRTTSTTDGREGHLRSHENRVSDGSAKCPLAQVIQCWCSLWGSNLGLDLALLDLPKGSEKLSEFVCHVSLTRRQDSLPFEILRSILPISLPK